MTGPAVLHVVADQVWQPRAFPAVSMVTVSFDAAGLMRDVAIERDPAGETGPAANTARLVKWVQGKLRRGQTLRQVSDDLRDMMDVLGCLHDAERRHGKVARHTLGVAA